jgi:hypothetical protein
VGFVRGSTGIIGYWGGKSGRGGGGERGERGCVWQGGSSRVIYEMRFPGKKKGAERGTGDGA